MEWVRRLAVSKNRRKRLVVAGMATMPTRAATFVAAFRSIIDQVDLLYLYLDGHQEIPGPAKDHPRVVALFASDFPGLHGNGKFLGLALHKPDCLFLGADDDIAYPPDYVRKLRAGLAACSGRAVVGYHGAVLTEPFRRYQESRRVYAFDQELAHAKPVDVLGTGTLMFDTETLRFDVRKWPQVNLLDLHLAIEAARAKLPLICLDRRKGYLRPLEVEQADSIYAALKRDDSRQTDLVLQLQTLRSTFQVHRQQA